MNGVISLSHRHSVPKYISSISREQIAIIATLETVTTFYISHNTWKFCILVSGRILLYFSADNSGG
jgi:hypothetical protein